MPAKVDESSIVAGHHAVESLLLNSPEKINHLVLLQGRNNPKLHALQKIAREHSIRVHQLPKSKLDYWYQGPHQGVLAFCHSRGLDAWPAVKEKLIQSVNDTKPPLIVVPVAMEDPRNFGACIRSSVGFGANAILFQNKGNCGLTPTAAKAAAGAAEKLPICQVGDLEGELKSLQEAGFKIIGLDVDGEKSLEQFPFAGPLVLVIGGEDRGIPPHVRRACTHSVRIPCSPDLQSYNASVALSLLLYETARQNGFSRIQAEEIPKT